MYIASCCSACFVLFYMCVFLYALFVMVPTKLTFRHCLHHVFFKHLFNIYFTGIWPVVCVLLDVQLIQRTPSHICQFDMTSPTIKAAVDCWCGFSYRHSILLLLFSLKKFSELSHTFVYLTWNPSQSKEAVNS